MTEKYREFKINNLEVKGKSPFPFCNSLEYNKF